MTIRTARRLGHHIHKGLMLVIDPSTGATGSAGFAVFDKGHLIDSGDIAVNRTDKTHKRLREMSLLVNDYFDKEYTVLVLEQLEGGYAPKSLKGSIYVFQASVDAKHYFELVPKTWQAIARVMSDWTEANKSDEYDAIWLGISSIMYSFGWPESAKTRTKAGKLKMMEIIQEYGPEFGWWGIPEIQAKWEDATEEDAYNLFKEKK